MVQPILRGGPDGRGWPFGRPVFYSELFQFLETLSEIDHVADLRLFLGAGVRPPNPSWGTMISEGVDRIVTAPYLAIVPGAMLVLTVLSLNVFGDGVRDALDPRAKVKIDH